MNVEFTQEAIQGLLGEHAFVKESRQGNFQVNLRNIRSLSDDDKVTMLYKFRERLRAQGWEASVKLTYRNQATGTWQNWPCIWVDQGVVSQISETANLEKQIQRLFAVLESQGVEVPLEMRNAFGTGDQFKDERETAPDETDMEHAAAVERRKHDVAGGTNIRKTTDPTERGATLNRPSPGVGEDRLDSPRRDVEEDSPRF